MFEGCKRGGGIFTSYGQLDLLPLPCWHIDILYIEVFSSLHNKKGDNSLRFLGDLTSSMDLSWKLCLIFYFFNSIYLSIAAVVFLNSVFLSTFSVLYCRDMTRDTSCLFSVCWHIQKRSALDVCMLNVWIKICGAKQTFFFSFFFRDDVAAVSRTHKNWLFSTS